MFPPRPLDATNKAGMYMELLQAWGNGSVDSYNMAITPPNIFLKKEQPTLVLFLENFISVRMLRLCGSAILTGISNFFSWFKN
jgi:hypothetical protein